MPTVQLPVPDAGAGRPIFEELEVTALADGCYRLLVTPGQVPGLAAGDDIRLTPDQSPGFTVERRGGNLAVWLFFTDPTRIAEAWASTTAEVVAIGGYLDGVGQTSLVFTVPMAAGFDAVEVFFGAVAARTPGCTWTFANVYDKDGMPLNWWV